MDGLTIGRLAKAASVHVETIRYYERRGLIPKPSRRASGYRQFTQADVDRMRFIKQAKALGFTLEEIGALLSLKAAPAATCGDITRRIEVKLDDVEGKINILLGMKQALMKLKQACTQPGAPSRECPILEALDTETHHGKVQNE